MAIFQQSEFSLNSALAAVKDGDADALLLRDENGMRLLTLEGGDRAYRLLIEEMEEGAMTLSASGVVLYANRRFARMLDLPLESLIGSELVKWFGAQAGDGLRSLMSQPFTIKRAIEMDVWSRSGVYTPISLSISPLRLDVMQGALCVIATDLTHQKQDEAAELARKKMLRLLDEQKNTEIMLRESLATLRLHDNALGAISQAVVITDANLRITYVNKTFEAMTGYSQAEVLGTTCKFMQGGESSSQTIQEINHALDSRQAFHGEILNYRKDGTTYWNELSITPVFDVHGAVTQFVGVQRDITQRRLADEDLALAAKIFEQSGEGFIVMDAERRILKVNSAFTTITGFSFVEVFRQPMAMLNAEKHDAELASTKWAQVDSLGWWTGEVQKRRKDGSAYIQRLSLRRLADAAGATQHYIANFVDITEQKTAEKHVWRLAHYDVLTGLPNRVLLQERAAYALKMAQRGGEAVALMFLDLDHFKNINDSLGHDAGDQLLVEMSDRLKLNLRDQDVLARLGGDEFIVILPQTDAEGAARVAHKLLHAVETSFLLGTHEISISLSIGVALYPQDGADFDALAKCADTAMYRAKHSGRNTFQFHTAELQAQSTRTMRLENYLRKALELNQLHLCFQPQLSLESNQITGVEALLRWSHPVLGSVSPAEFIPVAESSGLITSIGSWVLKTAVQQLREWIESGKPEMTMAVNISAVQFRQPDFPSLVSDILKQAQLPARLLELELTESVALEDPLSAIETMNKLRAIGVKLSIDDFGTGYSSLSYLKQFKVHTIKIDQSFIQNLTDNADDQLIVGVIIGLAKNMGLRVVAEGVETELQMRYLQDHGCQDLQGYWFSRPIPLDKLYDLIQTHCASR